MALKLIFQASYVCERSYFIHTFYAFLFFWFGLPSLTYIEYWVSKPPQSSGATQRARLTHCLLGVATDCHSIMVFSELRAPAPNLQWACRFLWWKRRAQMKNNYASGAGGSDSIKNPRFFNLLTYLIYHYFAALSCHWYVINWSCVVFFFFCWSLFSA